MVSITQRAGKQVFGTAYPGAGGGPRQANSSRNPRGSGGQHPAISVAVTMSSLLVSREQARVIFNEYIGENVEVSALEVQRDLGFGCARRIILVRLPVIDTASYQILHTCRNICGAPCERLILCSQSVCSPARDILIQPTSSPPHTARDLSQPSR